MSGIISARAWGKVWAYRSTFLLGLLNTVETAFFAILLSLALGVIFGLVSPSGGTALSGRGVWLPVLFLRIVWQWEILVV